MKSAIILALLVAVLAGVVIFKVLPELRAQKEAEARRVVESRKAAAEAQDRAKQAEIDKQNKAERDRIAAEQARRQAEQLDIDATLKSMHLTSLMPGNPGLAIIDRQEYAEGDALPVGKGRNAKVVSVREDGIALTCDGLSFHLDPPGAPDLAALRRH